MRLLRVRTIRSPCVVEVPIAPTDLVTDKAAQAVPCRLRSICLLPALVSMASILGVTDKAHQASRVASPRMNDQSRAAVVKADERSVRVASETMRSDRRNEAVALGRANEESQAQSKSGDPTVSVVKRGVTGIAAEDTVNEKVNV